jgi:ribosomal-protein-serine acetyltransferase
MSIPGGKKPVALPNHLRIPSRGRARNHPLRSKRITLTPVDPADGPELWQVIDGSRAHLEQWLPWVPFNNTAIASQRYAESCASDWDSGRAVRLAIRRIGDRGLLGIIGLDNCVHIHKCCELGYWLREDATGRGLMTEAARLALDFAFDELGLHRIRCAAATENHASLTVIRHLGFQFEGSARQAEFVGNRWLDHHVFSLLSTDDRPWRSG